MHVIFLHGGSASTDGTRQDDEYQQSQVRQKMKWGVPSGEEEREGGVF